MPLPIRTGFPIASFTLFTRSNDGGTGLLAPETMTASAPPALGEVLGRVFNLDVEDRMSVLDVHVPEDEDVGTEGPLQAGNLGGPPLDYPLVGGVGPDEDVASYELRPAHGGH